MKQIQAIKHIVCYEQKDFMQQLINTARIMEDDELEVDIQYTSANGVFTALIIGRKQTKQNKVEKAHDKNIMCTVPKSTGERKQSKV